MNTSRHRSGLARHLPGKLSQAVPPGRLLLWLSAYLLLHGCASSAATLKETSPSTAVRNESVTQQKIEKLQEVLLEHIESFNETRRIVEWLADSNRQMVQLQSMVARAQQYEKVIEIIAQSTEPNTSQLACRDALESLRKSQARTKDLLSSTQSAGVLADAEAELERALHEAKSCVINYGEVSFIYFRLDSASSETDGRTVPEGLNPKFAELNQALFDKIKASCSKPGEIYLYGYSCDLGTVAYDTDLAHSRAVNLKRYLEILISGACEHEDIRIEANLGGIIDIVAAHYLDEEFIEYQRERNRVVAVFLFREPGPL